MTQQLPTRRSVAAGAVWAAPAVVAASAAPARAGAQECETVTVESNFQESNWVATVSDDARSATGTYTWVNPTGDGTDLTMTIQADTGNERTRFGRTLEIEEPIGGTGTPGISIGINDSGGREYEDGATVSVTFSRPVENLSFVLSDVDAANGKRPRDNGGQDRLSLVNSQITGTVQNTQYLQGSGTLSDPWRIAPGINGDVNNYTDNRGNVNFTTSGEITTFSWNWWMAVPVQRNESFANRQYLTNMKFDLPDQTTC